MNYPGIANEDGTYTYNGRNLHRRRNGYPTNDFLAETDDIELLRHMGVPGQHIRYIVRTAREGTYPVQVKQWLTDLPRGIYRPDIRDESQNPDLYGKGLAFYGPPNSGKTVMAGAALLAAVRLGVENIDPTLRDLVWAGACMGLSVDWQWASNLFRRASGEDDVAGEQAAGLRTMMAPSGDYLDRGDILLLDDIARGTSTPFSDDALHEILRKRMSRGFPTIVTTNYPPEQWPKVHDMVLSAYMERCFIPVRMGGE